MLDGELIHEYWDENDSEDVADCYDSHILLKWGGSLYNATRGAKFHKVQYDPPYN